MPNLILWKERELKKMRREMDVLFDRLCQDFVAHPAPFSLQPQFVVVDENDVLIVRTRLVGIESKDLQVTVSEDILYIAGSRHNGFVCKNSGVKQCGTFSSKIQLPCRVDIDQVKASFKDEFLEVVLPKWKSGRLKHIQIQTR